jgi:hypothetical protein
MLLHRCDISISDWSHFGQDLDLAGSLEDDRMRTGKMIMNMAKSLGKIGLKVMALLGLFWFSGTILVQGPSAWWETRQSIKAYDRMFPLDEDKTPAQIAERDSTRARIDEIVNGDKGWSAVAVSLDAEAKVFTGTLAECNDFTSSVRAELKKTNVFIGCSKN